MKPWKSALTALALSASLLWGAACAHAVSFTTSSGKILKDGQTFVVKGCNIAGENWNWNREVTQDASLIADVWKFNAVRVCNIIKVTNTPYQQYTINNDLDKIVNAFTAKGVVVIFEAHDHTGAYATDSSSPSLTEYANYYANLANKYKNNPYVWLDTGNEPGGQIYPENNGAQWIAMQQRIVKAIRDTGNNNIILCEGIAWGQEGGSWDANNVPDGMSAILSYGNQILSFGGKSYSNIVFSIHAYDQWGYIGGFSSDTKIANYISRVLNKGYALVIGEYGQFNAGHDTSPATNSMWKALKTYPNVGRMVWQWDGGDANDLTVWDSYSWAGSGWGINKTDGTKPTNLTTLGSQVWDDNHAGTTNNSPFSATTLYRLKNNQSGLYLTADGGGSEWLGVYHVGWNGWSTQKWNIIANADGTYRVSPTWPSNRVLTADGDTTAGKTVMQAAWQSSYSTQKWTFTSLGSNKYTLSPSWPSNRTLGVDSNSAWSTVKQLASGSGNDKSWLIEAAP